MEKQLLGRSLLAVTALGLPLLWWFSSPTGKIDFASTQLDSHPAELSIRPFDEPFSVPDRGSSLFDKIFSKKNAQGVREYEVPFPFNQVTKKLQEVNGGVPPLIAIFPMGRSLQRSAAIEGMTNVTSLDPFFRFPRVVMGFDQESVNAGGKMSLNLKERLYIGMNEKAKLLEVISYNDEAGRFEYQVVRDFDAGKKPQVFYANRQLCLTCHQNQTPIFSRAPWNESNAHQAMQDGLTRVLKANLGEKPCSQDDLFCYRDNGGNRDYFYVGAPLVIDQKVPYALDQTTKVANYFPAYHKMWQRLCSDLECRKELLKELFFYKLIGQKTLLQAKSVQQFNQMLKTRWATEFPNGMKLPEAAIPNRDPLLNHKDRGQEDLSLINGKQSHVKTGLEQVLSNSDVPGEFEPLLPRSPSELWSSPLEEDGRISRLVSGYAGFFTASDAKVIDDILVASPVGAEMTETVQSQCRVKRGANADKADFSISCGATSATNGVQFATFVRVPPGSSELQGVSKALRLFSAQFSCDPQAIATPENLADGIACLQAENLVTRMRQAPDSRWILSFQSSAGLSVRFLDGRRLSSVYLPDLAPGEEKTVPVQFAVLRDGAPLAQAMEAAYKSGAFKKYVDGPALDRISAMNMVLGFLGKPSDEFMTLTKEMTTLKKKTEAPDDEIGELPLKPSERAFTLAMRNCGACHYNREGVPPAYLGGPQESPAALQKCMRVSACTARILYRLKMWDCPESEYQIKKTPMPPTSRMKATGVDLEKWKRNERKQLFDSLLAVYPQMEVLQYMTSQGVSANEAQAFVNDLRKFSCPTGLSTLFEKLPRCDQEKIASAQLCQ